MQKYSATLDGKNFPLNLEGETALFGFYTTRRVKASTPEEAESAAVAMIRGDVNLLDVIDISVASNPEIFLDDISKLKLWSCLGDKGYTYYRMECECHLKN